MKILNIGSLNIDYTYSQDHIVAEGETLAATKRTVNCGGKGLNQSIALAQAGAKVFHAGKIGAEGEFLKERIAKGGADVSLIKQSSEPTGHAIIQVDSRGRNSIVILGGANQDITVEDIDTYLEGFEAGDLLLLQNETSNLEYAITAAKAKGMKIALNPSPIDEKLLSSKALAEVDIFILNETEGCALTGESEPPKICSKMQELYGPCITMLTLGSKGCVYNDEEWTFAHDIYKVDAVDTTAAGDTFTGFFLASLMRGESPEQAIELASKASSIAVTRPGAADSVPTLSEVFTALYSR